MVTANKTIKSLELSSLIQSSMTQAAKDDTDAKQTVHKLMEQGAKIQVQFKNRKSDGSPYIYVSSDTIEGCVIDATEKNAVWLINYLVKNEVNPIPDGEDNGAFDGCDDIAEGMMNMFINMGFKVKFAPLYKSNTYINSKLNLKKGCICFSWLKTDELVESFLERNLIV